MRAAPARGRRRLVERLTGRSRRSPTSSSGVATCRPTPTRCAGRPPGRVHGISTRLDRRRRCAPEQRPRMTTDDSRWQFWIDRGGTFYRHCRPAPDGSLVTHKLLSEKRSGTVTRRWPGCATCWACRTGEPITPRAGGVREMGTTVATTPLLLERRASRRCWSHAGLSTRCAFALPEPPAHLRPPDRAARRCSMPAWSGRGAHGRARRRGAALDEATCAPSWKRQFDAGLRSVAIVFMHGYRYRTRTGGGAAGARGRLPPGSAPRHRVSAADEVRRPRRHHGGGCLPVAHPAPLCRQVAAVMPGVRLFFMQSSGRADRRHAFRGKGRHPVRPGRGHRGHGADRSPGFDQV